MTKGQAAAFIAGFTVVLAVLVGVFFFYLGRQLEAAYASLPEPVIAVAEPLNLDEEEDYIPYEPYEPYEEYEEYEQYEPPAPFEPIFMMEPLPYEIIQKIQGSSFHDSASFSYDFLTYLTITHVDFYGEYQVGNMIVAAEIGYEVLDIFRYIFEYRFPIHQIRLIDYFYANDYYSMADNNTVAFNFRYIAGTSRLSRHAFGMAIDINPIQNPYIRGDVVWPAAGRTYMDRSYVRPGMIIRGDPVYRAFMSRGWIWGGNWRLPRDYHHFERSN